MKGLKTLVVALGVTFWLPPAAQSAENSTEPAEKSATPVRINGVEARGIAEARVPALASRPVDRRLDLRERHRLDAVVALRLAHSVAARACGLDA